MRLKYSKFVIISIFLSSHFSCSIFNSPNPKKFEDITRFDIALRFTKFRTQPDSLGLSTEDGVEYELLHPMEESKEVGIATHFSNLDSLLKRFPNRRNIISIDMNKLTSKEWPSDLLNKIEDYFQEQGFKRVLIFQVTCFGNYPLLRGDLTMEELFPEFKEEIISRRAKKTSKP